MQKKMEDGLGELFGLSRDAVIGVRGRQVVFANPAAEELFGPDLMDRPCTALLPEFVFEPGEFEVMVGHSSSEVLTGKVSLDA